MVGIVNKFGDWHAIYSWLSRWAKITYLKMNICLKYVFYLYFKSIIFQIGRNFIPFG
jgi:hypothetical protein